MCVGGSCSLLWHAFLSNYLTDLIKVGTYQNARKLSDWLSWNLMWTRNALKMSILNFGNLMLTGIYFQTSDILGQEPYTKLQFTKWYSYVYDVSRKVIPRRGHKVIQVDI